jgi:MFS superfamily sulfate permease-like transporter
MNGIALTVIASQLPALFGLFSRLGAPCFLVTIGEAVGRYVESQSVPWVDWEDR